MVTTDHKNLKITESTLGAYATTYTEAIECAGLLGYPVVVSSSFALPNDIDGMAFAVDGERELHRLLQGAFDASPIHQILIKRIRMAGGRRKREWLLNKESS